MAGFKFLHVPYKGATQIATDVISGQVQTGIGSYTGMMTQIQAGRMRLIGVTNNVRVPNNRELPIFADVVPGYDMRGWFGYIAPAGTPRAIVKKLNEEINRAMQQPDVNAKLVGSGLIVVNESAEFYGEFIKSEYAKYGKIVRDIGLQPQ
jgi:tripartite-type tricarboxylate transporter receptor subunit TctC